MSVYKLMYITSKVCMEAACMKLSDPLRENLQGNVLSNTILKLSGITKCGRMPVIRIEGL